MTALPFLSRAEVNPQPDRKAVDRQHQGDEHDRRAVDGSSSRTPLTDVDSWNRCMDRAMQRSRKP